MSNWSYDKPPTFRNPKHGDPVGTTKGWEDPQSGEVLATIADLTVKAGASDIVEIILLDGETVINDPAIPLSLTVRFNERVDVHAGAYIELTWLDADENQECIRLHALCQYNENIITFDKACNLTDSVFIPHVADSVISVPCQNLHGTIRDHGTMCSSHKHIGNTLIEATNTVHFVLAAIITEIALGEGDLERGYPISVDVTFSQKVNVGCGVRLTVHWTGNCGNFHLYAQEQCNVNVVTFAYKSDLSCLRLIPDEAGTLSICPQTIHGFIIDHVNELCANKEITSDVANTISPVVISGPATVTLVEFDSVYYDREYPISVTVTFSEAVDASEGLSLDVSWSGCAGDFCLYANEQLDSTTVVFNKAQDLMCNVYVPNETGALSIEAQNIRLHCGTLYDANTTADSNRHISCDVANAVDEIIVSAAARPLSIEFSADAFLEEVPFTVFVTFDELVDIAEGSSLIVHFCGCGPDVEVFCNAHTGSSVIAFDKAANLTDPALTPSNQGTLSIHAQAITGDIFDSGTTAPSCPYINCSVASTAGSVLVDEVAVVEDVYFDDTGISRRDPLSVVVEFDERVSVSSGASLLVNWTGTTDTFRVYAEEQLDTCHIYFNKKANLLDDATVPNEAGSLSIEAQTILGTITDIDSELNSDRTISSEIAGFVEPIVMNPPAQITNFFFDSNGYYAGHQMAAIVEYDNSVDVIAGASIEIGFSNGPSFRLYATEQSDTNCVYFYKQADLSTDSITPLIDGTLSISIQTLHGTIKDHGTNLAVSNMYISNDVVQYVNNEGLGDSTNNSPYAITSATFNSGSYSQTDPLSVIVQFEGTVAVAEGASVVVSWNGGSGNITLYAVAQGGTNNIVFDKDITLLAGVNVPSEPGTLSIVEQTLSGAITDYETTAEVNKLLYESAATGAGSFVVS